VNYRQHLAFFKPDLIIQNPDVQRKVPTNILDGTVYDGALYDGAVYDGAVYFFL
jgi:hypothetical protein